MSRSPRSRKWTADELALLRRLARRVPVREIALNLGRTVTAVRTKAAHERLTLLPDDTPGRPRAPLPWDAEP